MKRMYIVSALLAFCMIPHVARGCSCLTGTPAIEFNRAKTIFIGRMLGGTEKLSGHNQDGTIYPIEAGHVRFAVEEVFKGSLGGETTVEIASMKGTSCGDYGLKRGEHYIVYAYAGDKDPDTLYTGVCTRTAPADSNWAKEDLDFLRNLPLPGTGGNLEGRVWADLKAGGATPLADVKVRVRGDDHNVAIVTTNRKGEFELKNLKAGVYSVEPDLPKNYWSNHKTAQVKVDDRGTAVVGFEAYLNGKIAGRLVDKDGHEFNSAFLHLEAGEVKSVYGHSTGNAGSFEAVGVPPGEYIIYLEMQGSDYKQKRKFYYPGTFDRADAELIKLGLGDAVDGLQFALPENFKVRTIQGQVFWPDGQPASKVQVMLLCPKSAKADGFHIEFTPTVGVADEQGRFQLEGFTGEVYWVEARGGKMNGGKDGKNEEFVYVHSPTNRIVVNENLENIKLVLSEKGLGGGCSK
jgi:prealbumin domain-containing protein